VSFAAYFCQKGYSELPETMRDNSSNVKKINSKNIRQVALENNMEN